MVYRVLANDGMHDEGLWLFEKYGFDVDTRKLKGDDLLSKIGDYHALLVRSATKVTKEIIEAGTAGEGRLDLVGRAGVGYDNVDVQAANENGVIVKFAPHGNTNATAELALNLMMCCARNTPQSYASLKGGVWEKKKFQGIELSGKTLGIIGCGRIGQRLSQLVQGFGMSVVGYDGDLDLVKSRFPDSLINYFSRHEVLNGSDFISIHTGGKKTIIEGEDFRLINPNAILINASRGGNIDEAALYNALKEGGIRAAGLDSYVGEPKEEGALITESMQKLASLENVVLTSHLGASTEEAQEKTSLEMAKVVMDYFLEGDFTNAVNVRETVEGEGKETYSLFVHHEDSLGMFGKIASLLGKYSVNLRDNPSRQFFDPKTGSVSFDVKTVFLVHNPISPEILGELRKIVGVYRVGV